MTGIPTYEKISAELESIYRNFKRSIHRLWWLSELLKPANIVSEAPLVAFMAPTFSSCYHQARLSMTGEIKCTGVFRSAWVA